MGYKKIIVYFVLITLIFLAIFGLQPFQKTIDAERTLVNQSGIYENEVIEYTGKSSNDLTGCTRGTSAPYRGVSPVNTTASSHATGAKIFGAYKISFLEETEELAGYNDSSGNPALTTTQVGFGFELVSNASSTETGGGLQCTVGPINDRG